MHESESYGSNRRRIFKTRTAWQGSEAGVPTITTALQYLHQRTYTRGIGGHGGRNKGRRKTGESSENRR